MPALRVILAVLLLAMASLPAAAEPAAAEKDSAFGVWFTQDHDAAFDLYPCAEGALCGRLIWMADESPDPGGEGPPRDLKNPDPAKRSHTLCGMELLTGFHQDEDGIWDGGRIYNPEDGELYRVRIDVRGPFTLGLRGYILIPLLGRTQIWTRVPPDFDKRCRTE
ncbi:MAG: DUF2147 domain-containing protein [Rhodospirillaceae bacterium]